MLEDIRMRRLEGGEHSDGRCFLFAVGPLAAYVSARRYGVFWGARVVLSYPAVCGFDGAPLGDLGVLLSRLLSLRIISEVTRTPSALATRCLISNP